MGVDESIGDKSERRNSFYNKQESTNQTLQRKQSLSKHNFFVRSYGEKKFKHRPSISE